MAGRSGLRMTRIPLLCKLLPVALLASLAVFAAAPADAAQDDVGCATTPSGIVACGTVTAVFGSASTAEGEATGTVTWTHCLDTWYPTTTNCNTLTAPAYAGTVTGPYWTTTCVHGRLLADGVLVAETMWIC